MYSKMGELDPRLTASQHHLRFGSRSPLTGRGETPKPRGQTRGSVASGPLPRE